MMKTKKRGIVIDTADKLAAYFSYILVSPWFNELVMCYRKQGFEPKNKKQYEEHFIILRNKAYALARAEARQTQKWISEYRRSPEYESDMKKFEKECEEW